MSVEWSWINCVDVDCAHVMGSEDLTPWAMCEWDCLEPPSDARARLLLLPRLLLSAFPYTQRMLFDPETASDLKPWLVRNLEPM